MANPFIVASRHDLALRPSPIEPSWIKEGNPEAKSAEIARSKDGTASTLVWECTPGRFDWFYDLDELIHLVSGSIVVSADGMEPTRFGAGDVLFFAKGAHAHWVVEETVRKVAFCHQVQPRMVGLALRVVSKIRRTLFPSRQPSTGGLLGASA